MTNKKHKITGDTKEKDPNTNSNIRPKKNQRDTKQQQQTDIK